MSSSLAVTARRGKPVSRTLSGYCQPVEVLPGYCAFR
jgi:hypothetical protein